MLGLIRIREPLYKGLIKVEVLSWFGILAKEQYVENIIMESNFQKLSKQLCIE